MRRTADAEGFVQGGAWASVLALAEATGVLAMVYKLSSSDLATAIEMLLSHRSCSAQNLRSVFPIV
jgi:hypothetical protein